MGERVGVPWLGHRCGVCWYCVAHQENLCDCPLFTGYTRDGRFATATIADARYAFSLGELGTDEALAPLLCAGLIGWRSLVIAGEGKKLGLYGFDAAAHIVAQVAEVAGPIGICLHAVGRYRRPGLRATDRHRHDDEVLSAQPSQPGTRDLRAGRFEGAAVLVP